MRYSVLLLALTIFVAVDCKLKHENLRRIIGRFLKASFEHTTNCMQEAGTTDEAINNFWNHEIAGEKDRNLQCYLRCAFLKTGIVDEKGYLLVDELLHTNGVVHQIVSHHPAIIGKLNEHCKVPKSGDMCEAAFHLTQCGFKYVMEYS